MAVPDVADSELAHRAALGLPSYATDVLFRLGFPQPGPCCERCFLTLVVSQPEEAAEPQEGRDVKGYSLGRRPRPRDAFYDLHG